ncbi:PaaI family thioesterase [Paraherbaspirillum soli]|uniref:PaaI family thioesterase n=1 Tax=Paraherbaspirillum soli TaxID=631222 RepID=A0ABW0MCX5_9BURK
MGNFDTSECERIVRWTDAAAAAAAVRGVSGREILERIRTGKHPAPPMAALIGFQIQEVAEGRVVMTLTPHPSLANPMGTIHGGAAATLLDTAMGCAVHTLLPVERGFATLELKLNYVRPIHINGDDMIGEGRVLNVSRQTVLAEGSLRDRAGKLFVHATATFSLFDMPIN